MTGPVEQREESRPGPGGTSSPFPIEWGPPPGRDGNDLERRAWIRRHVGGAAEQRNRQLAKRDAALATFLLRAELEARR